MVEIDPKELSLFQKWVLLRFHQSQNQALVDADLITGCCITAMDQKFNKDVGRNELAYLEKYGFIREGEIVEKYEEGFGKQYFSTIDGVIFAKKIMKPILSAMNKEEFAETIKKLDSSEARLTMEQMFRDSKARPQQEILGRLADFGLRNISGFSKLVELVAASLGI